MNPFDIEPYASVEDAEDYFETRLHSEEWHYASDLERLNALKEATRRIDRLRFNGRATFIDQIRKFPRNPDLEIPIDIKIACCEIAIALLDGTDMEKEIENLIVNTQSYASVSTSYDSSQTLEHIRAGIPSSTAWQILLRWMPSPRSLKLRRI